MNLEQFKSELEAKLAAMSDDELRAGLELAGCVFDEPWLDPLLDETDPVCVSSSDVGLFAAADSNELALAA